MSAHGVRIDNLSPTGSPSPQHEFPVMRNGQTNKMTVLQAMALARLFDGSGGDFDFSATEVGAAIIEVADYLANLKAGQVEVDPVVAGAIDVQAVLAALEQASSIKFDNDGVLLPGAPTSVQAAIAAFLSDGRLRAELALPGQVVQEVVAQSTVDDVTTSATMQDTSLVASITPLFSNSIIEAMAIVPNVHIVRVSGNITSRFGMLRIWNVTDGVDVSSEFPIGRILFSPSASIANTVAHAVVIGRYPLSSTVPRQFRLQSRVGTATDLEIRIFGNTAPTTMVLREIRQ